MKFYKKQIYFFVIFQILIYLTSNCTHYTAQRQVAAPPILIGLTRQASGTYFLQARATNPEPQFQFYSLYVGASESDSRNSASGTDCTPSNPALAILPAVYTFEIGNISGPVTAGTSCRFNVNVTTGQYISVKTLTFSVNPQPGANQTRLLRLSIPSNTIVVP